MLNAQLQPEDSPKSDKSYGAELFSVPPGENQLSAYAQRIRDLSRQPHAFEVRFSPIELEDLESLYLQMRVEGPKFRYDWDAASKTAFLRTRDQIQTIPLLTWLSAVQTKLRLDLTRAAACGSHSLLISLSHDCVLSDGSILGPDLSISIYNAEKGYIDPDLAPRVVFEYTTGRSLSYGLEKSWNFLFRTRAELAIHAVVLCQLLRKSPEHAISKFGLDIWVREHTGDVDIDYPLDDCSEASGDDQSSTGGSGTGAAEEQPQPPEATFDQVEDPERFYAPVSSSKRMWRRNSETIIIYDEENDNQLDPLPDLEMDAYDFLRVCNADPNHPIDAKDRSIRINLDKLRRLVRLLAGPLKRAEQPGSSSRMVTARGLRREAPPSFATVLKKARHSGGSKPSGS